MIRDITMAYTQSQTKLARVILAALPQELKRRYPEGTILRIVKPLYGIAEAGAHWFNTYHDHHCRKLNMETSSFDPCLLITANNIADKDLFGIAALQTDDTFIAKPKEILQEGSICDFNGSRLTIQNGCVIALNKRIEWQINNPDRGLCYIPIDLESAKIFVFTDGSFANNKDLSSQIGFVIIIANETASTKYSYSLYECLVKLGTTTEKRLMIDIMALRQAYESRDIAEIRWVNGADNPADAMTKASPNSALTQFISDNQLNVRVEGFVHRNNTTILDEI
ncbi:hypothetical protein HRG_001545 [Hirsutella rhossiliensis]|uniref:Uncharacterized protein n=1 Tax=Hirsutella rhossiliensis TaxID=111463 RepID=A0A9P8MU48_9HYPO|nr:uncharacterized protein HRG_06275 [Hirsutella rhossiliensis]XP_044722837.1 uncharacterized protein HRG_03340 [Hirsutella rhossiliensis]XP_044726416.1 uncharacterized protein HRG_01545 [Hirsutella rhossiliensis]KAH0962173.1 hypothetical protein HRG_06275 [Hirsutella rhossiliensis]KAH0965324.1 hypothetical protein HRG_03340 [Hirsutella rhossiliensis]KAH0968903.1 hypothetical protein HRG_01545 [Hirsutella rhossiliensis]